MEKTENKEFQPVSIRLEKSIVDQLESFCNDMRMSRNSVIANSIVFYLGSDYVKNMLKGRNGDS